MTRAHRAVRIRGRSAVDPTAWKTRRYERTRRRVSTGALPRPDAYRTWSWVSTGRTCDGCGEVVGAAEIQHDVDVNGTIVLRLHPECFRAWCESAYSGGGASGSVRRASAARTASVTPSGRTGLAT
jgi:hypothetical protein